MRNLVRIVRKMVLSFSGLGIVYESSWLVVYVIEFVLWDIY